MYNVAPKRWMRRKGKGMLDNKPIDLIVFSGTGNTLLAAIAMRDYFRETGFTAVIKRMEKTDPASIDPDHIIGLCVPVAVQSSFPLVHDFVAGLPEVNDTGVFLLDTMGMYSGGLLGPMRKILKRKGYRLLGAKEIIMPSNFGKKVQTAEKKNRIIQRGLKQARRFAHDLHVGHASWPLPFLFAGIMYRVSRWEFLWRKMRQSISPDLDTSACIRCGHCYRLCPADNIRMYEFPEFGDHCQFCMRCFSYCPVNAISIGKMVPYRAVTAVQLLHPEK